MENLRPHPRPTGSAFSHGPKDYSLRSPRLEHCLGKGSAKMFQSGGNMNTHQYVSSKIGFRLIH